MVVSTQSVTGTNVTNIVHWKHHPKDFDICNTRLPIGKLDPMYVVMAGILILSPITQWELPHQHRTERKKKHTHDFRS